MIHTRIRILSKALVFAVAGIVLLAVPGQSQKKKSTWDGVYSAAQADRGMETFKNQCAACHGESMQGGGGAPAAAGAEFLFSWNKKNLGELIEYLKGNMPPGQAGSLSDQRYTDIIAAILKTSEFPAGGADLPADAKALGEIQILREKP
jgi:S-disulfanyl-L-cysteine oxidoreductase SoxD